MTHLGRRAGVHAVLGWAQGRRLSLETAAVLGLAELPEKQNGGCSALVLRKPTGGASNLPQSKEPCLGSDSYCLEVLSKRVLQALLTASLSGKIYKNQPPTGEYQW